MELVTGSTAIDRNKLQAHGRSRVTNGKELLPNVDGRSLVARRYRDIAAAIMADQGGSDRCSESRKQLIRRFAAASVLAERLEAKLANGEQIDLAQHSLLASTLVRLAARIGIDRVARDVTPTLADYLSQHHSAADDQAPGEATELSQDSADPVEATSLAADQKSESVFNVEAARGIPSPTDNRQTDTEQLDEGNDYFEEPE